MLVHEAQIQMTVVIDTVKDYVDCINGSEISYV